jgi:Permuted papain-like amidase enzyme, YaeF/YiiX, C92 family
MLQRLKEWVGQRILRYLSTPSRRYAPFFAPPLDVLRQSLQPGDILLIEGNTRLSTVIKFLTQSTWSHAALYVGDAGKGKTTKGELDVLLEAYNEVGVVLSPLSKYEEFNTRICRPIGLTDQERRKIIDYALARVGMQYDNKQIFDLARYLFPYPPVPVFFRRRMLAIGSGDPTRAICSTLIAEAFESVRYPILPENVENAGYGIAPFVQSETDHIRKHGLYTPRDFDISPYFAVIKPVIVNKFNYHTLEWSPKETAPTKVVRARGSKAGGKQARAKPAST